MTYRKEVSATSEEQLSAISQQIQVIQDAIREKRPSLHLLGKDVEVNFNAGIFVTLNPAGKGYGGRSKLPDNLKLLFRPVAMARPDNELIAARQFTPDEYLPETLADMAVLPAGAPVQVSFDIKHPGIEAINYEVSFGPQAPR